MKPLPTWVIDLGWALIFCMPCTDTLMMTMHLLVQVFLSADADDGAVIACRQRIFSLQGDKMIAAQDSSRDSSW